VALVQFFAAQFFAAKDGYAVEVQVNGTVKFNGRTHLVSTGKRAMEEVLGRL
jgi:hypothetical protein